MKDKKCKLKSFVDYSGKTISRDELERELKKVQLNPGVLDCTFGQVVKTAIFHAEHGNRVGNINYKLRCKIFGLTKALEKISKLKDQGTGFELIALAMTLVAKEALEKAEESDKDE